MQRAACSHAAHIDQPLLLVDVVAGHRMYQQQVLKHHLPSIDV